MAESVNSNIGTVMADLARSLSTPDDLDGVLRRVTSASVSMIPGTDCADILIVSGRKKFESLASTSELPPQLDAVQVKFGQGPCLDAAVDAFLVRSNDLEFEARWPRFTKAALDAGVRSMLSFQLYTRTDTAGALNLFAFEPNAFDDESIEVGEVLAAHAAVAIIAARTDLQLRSALVNREIIGQAKGMLMERFRIPADQAFGLLTKLSQDSNTPLSQIAKRIVEAGPDSST
jgi:transcriptional regulator with GAF, ATPase, and Fis domain